MRKKTRERIEGLEMLVRGLNQDIRRLGYGLKRLECEHENVEFESFYDSYKGNMFVKVCQDCGKYLEEYPSEKEMFAAKLEYTKERNKKNLDAVKREMADG